MLPTFVVIGAMKAGTTSLYDYLAAHPQVFMAEPKELNFFVSGKNWERGLEWYEERFAAGGAARARGEVSPDYTKADVFPHVPERIAAVCPDVRLVYLVRDPVERMISMYHHELAAGREARPVDRALLEGEHYLNTSRYAWQLDRFLEHFSREQLLVVRSEDLRDRRGSTMGRIYGFAGVEPVDPGDDFAGERGRSVDKRVVGPRTRRLLGAPLLRSALAGLPAGARRTGRRLVGRPVDTRAGRPSGAVVEELRQRLAPDVERLRDHLGAEFDGWGMI